MHLKNEAARLITINTMEGERLVQYRILPGENPAVEVPESVAKIDFVKALLKNGSLRRVGSDELSGADDDSSDEEQEDGEEIDLLRTEAEELGINVDKRWGINRLKEEIAKA